MNAFTVDNGINLIQGTRKSARGYRLIRISFQLGQNIHKIDRKSIH